MVVLLFLCPFYLVTAEFDFINRTFQRKQKRSQSHFTSDQRRRNFRASLVHYIEIKARNKLVYFSQLVKHRLCSRRKIYMEMLFGQQFV